MPPLNQVLFRAFWVYIGLPGMNVPLLPLKVCFISNGSLVVTITQEIRVNLLANATTALLKPCRSMIGCTQCASSGRVFSPRVIGPGTMDHQSTQIAVSILAHAPELYLTTGTVLTRYQPQPGTDLSSALELPAIANCCAASQMTSASRASLLPPRTNGVTCWAGTNIT
jgi:hypothetical protein